MGSSSMRHKDQLERACVILFGEESRDVYQKMGEVALDLRVSIDPRHPFRGLVSVNMIADEQ